MHGIHGATLIALLFEPLCNLQQAVSVWIQQNHINPLTRCFHQRVGVWQGGINKDHFMTRPGVRLGSAQTRNKLLKVLMNIVCNRRFAVLLQRFKQICLGGLGDVVNVNAGISIWRDDLDGSRCQCSIQQHPGFKG